MKYMDTLGRYFTPDIIGNVPTGKLLWVDAVHGNDDLAVRERLTVPFKTLNGAKAAAVSGDTIVVMPGTYNERNLLKNNVNWHFLNGAIVLFNGTGDGAIFDTSANGTNAAVVSQITGFGDFRCSPTSGTAHVIHSDANNSTLYVEARRLIATQECVNVSDNGTGSLHLVVHESIQGNSADAILFNGGNSASNIIRAHRIYTSGGACLQVNSGNADVRAHVIESSADAAIRIEGGSGRIVVQAFEIHSQTSSAIFYDAFYSPELIVLQSRIKSSLNSLYGRAVQIDSASSNAVKLSGCVLLPYSTADSIYADNTGTKVQLHSQCVSTKDLGQWVVPVGSSLVVDTEIA